jgi:hypothetical protein
MFKAGSTVDSVGLGERHVEILTAQAAKTQRSAIL